MTPWQLKHNAIGIVLGIVLTSISYLIGLHFGWINEVSKLEAFSVFASYWCTYLCVVQSRWNYPIGMISVAALGFLFWQQGLLSSMALQIYLFFTLPYGWYYWRSDEDTRPVRSLKFGWNLVAYGILVVVSYLAATNINEYFHGTNSGWDTAIFVGSILAQWMLDRKLRFNWWLWLAVDIVSVIVYWHNDAKVLAIQMGLFGLNAIWAYLAWTKTIDKDISVKSPSFAS